MPGHMMDMDEELPPRTRRIRSQSSTILEKVGTTSAYAENTTPRPQHPLLDRNYLRVRGEY